jgi:hypothetical protein
VLEKLGRKDRLLDIAMELEKIALQDDYFVKRWVGPGGLGRNAPLPGACPFSRGLLLALPPQLLSPSTVGPHASACVPPRSSLYPNVDFYSGIVLRALGIPVEMYTVLFAMARTVGWVAQVRLRRGGGLRAASLVADGGWHRSVGAGLAARCACCRHSG